MVMKCSRRGCDNVLCDRYSSEYGYICCECFEELIAFCNQNGPDHIAKFMDSRKRPGVNADEYKDRMEKICDAEFPRGD